MASVQHLVRDLPPEPSLLSGRSVYSTVCPTRHLDLMSENLQREVHSSAQELLASDTTEHQASRKIVIAVTLSVGNNMYDQSCSASTAALYHQHLTRLDATERQIPPSNVAITHTFPRRLRIAWQQSIRIKSSASIDTGGSSSRQALPPVLDRTRRGRRCCCAPLFSISCGTETEERHRGG
jgi:hypothetical protein